MLAWSRWAVEMERPATLCRQLRWTQLRLWRKGAQTLSCPGLEAGEADALSIRPAALSDQLPVKGTVCPSQGKMPLSETRRAPESHS